ncbi:unnamed protein product [Ceutorhynchus assimilis]|uniref:Glucosidase II subunit alpha n=1 Tax=Ceutorhynchus assimilis TaxID=467358 RepID=A0A9N9QPP8_9CUCU|nr:unnamed protein product [Ceutorhynchus assimilis]
MELLRLLVLGIALWATTAVADSNLDIPFPYNCSTRTTCSSLRKKLPNENQKFNAQLVDSSANKNSTLLFDLTNKRGDKLTLSISAVEGKRFRVIIEEHDEHRYKLEHSLEKEPNLVKLTIVETSNISVTAQTESGSKIIVKTIPLSIEFYQDNALTSIFEGNRIIFEDTEESQAFTFSVQFPNANRLMGLHEHADNLKLRHTVDFSIDPYRLRNTDYGTTEYSLNTTKSMYGSIPVIYGFGNNTSSGIFHHNAAEQWIDINNNRHSAYFMVDGGRLDLFVLLGPSLPEAVRQYVDLTGKPHLPQLWALGYHQCRWAYNTTGDVMDTIGNFDAYDFPLDVLWLDIEYTSERKWFTWNASSFPDPVKLLNWVDAQGHRKLVPISDPHIKIDPAYKVYNDLLHGGWFVNNSDGLSPFVGECWPGNSSWVDYLNPDARNYYAQLHLYENFPSTSALGGYWNDMNEPTLFDNLYERTFPFDLVHHGGVRHRDVHNIYGMLQTMSTHKGLMARDKGTLRPFILSRAYFAGSQRYANKWSGDNWGDFEDLRYSVPMALTSNLVGLPFYGADIPGFFGTATEELLVRWYQIGIWLPFFRAHAAQGSPRREPFRFGNETQAILRKNMQLRYKHLPYWYTLFYENTVTGDPILRPLLYQYPEDPVGYDLDDEFLIGTDILTTSVYESNATSVRIYFPGQSDKWVLINGNSTHLYNGGTWANISIDITFTPAFYRAGSIIPRKPKVLRSTADIKDDPLEVHVVLDDDRKARGKLYVDDFESFKYQNEKEYLYYSLAYDDATSTLISFPIDTDNNPGNLTVVIDRVVIYTSDNAGQVSVRKVEVDNSGKKLNTINFMNSSIKL